MTAFFMKKRMLAKAIVPALFILTSACAATNQTGGSSGSPSYNFTIMYPEEWKRLNTERFFMITREGPFKQYIMARQRHVDKPFKNTDKRIRKDMAPREVANVILDEINSDESVLDFRLIESVPVSLNGYEGYRTVCTYRTKKGDNFKAIFYDLLIGEWLYGLRYNAAEGYFCEKDIETFQGVLNSFKIK